MNNQLRSVSESSLKTDLNDLAHSLVRELAMAAKKLAIYGTYHPTAKKAVHKPFVFLSQIFHYRRFVTINLQQGFLYVMNIRQKDNVFTEQVIQYMQLQDLQAIVIDVSVSSQEFTIFLERLARRLPPSDPEYRVTDMLTRRDISSIEVNSVRAFELFEKRKQYRGDVDGDFTIKRIVLDQVGEDVRQLAHFLKADDITLQEHLIDFYSAVVAYVIPEKIVGMPAESVREQLTAWADELKREQSRPEDELERFLLAMKLVEYHPNRQMIVSHLGDEVLGTGLLGGIRQDPGTETGKIKVSYLQRIENILENSFNPATSHVDPAEFHDAFVRLVRTGQHAQAHSALIYLLRRLSDSNPGFRQNALNLLTLAVQDLKGVTDAVILEKLVDNVLDAIDAHSETFEFSELIAVISKKCLDQTRFDLMAKLACIMARRRTEKDGVTIYDSMAIKKAFENINQPIVIDHLVTEILKNNHQVNEDIKRIMVAVGSEEIALALSEIIAHPIRQVRQLSLRILAELGKASLRVFSRILIDDGWFEREEGRNELTDSKWYVVRNSIFVIGSLKDSEGLAPLRLRLKDPDVRVRREIVTSLEKIGCEDSVDLLALMAEDSQADIAQAAVIAIGMTGTTDAVPLLVDIGRRNHSVILRVIAALGRIGGDDARQYLVELLADDDRQVDLAEGKVSKDDLQVAIVRALGSIGDRPSLDGIRSFKDGIPAARKVLFKNSPLQKAISEILARQ